MEILARNIEDDVRDGLGASRIMVLLGPRQAGKSTLAKVIRDSAIIDSMRAGQVPSVSTTWIGRTGYAEAIVAGGFPEARRRSRPG